MFFGTEQVLDFVIFQIVPIQNGKATVALLTAEGEVELAVGRYHAIPAAVVGIGYFRTKLAVNAFLTHNLIHIGISAVKGKHIRSVAVHVVILAFPNALPTWKTLSAYSMPLYHGQIGKSIDIKPIFPKKTP
jgi:hypothetical protein